MRLRYRTRAPNAVWYDIVDLSLPRDLEGAKEALVLRCREFFGSQFGRYDQIVVSLMRGADSLVDIDVDPPVFEQKLADMDNDDLRAA